MTEKKESATKRVSFAAEPQINYIHQEEFNTTKTSSSTNDIPMDITTDLLEFKNMNLFNIQKQDKLGDTGEDSLVKDGEIDDIGSFSRRYSLDPLSTAISMDVSVHQDSVTEDEEENPQSICAEDNKCENPSVWAASKENQPAQNTNLFWRYSIKNEPRMGLEDGFNDTGIMNSSFAIEELVNTIDLRKIIPQERKEQKNINEFLSSQGIRFLDEAIINGMKRDTLSKSRNIVDPAMESYYKFSLRERIDFLYNFSSYLIDKMKDLQRDIEEVQDQIDADELNKENLKAIRNESRNKSKIDWYGLRKIYEIQFNKKIIENKNKVTELLGDRRKESLKIEELIIQKSRSTDELRKLVDSMKARVMQNNENKIQETEKLQSMIEDRKKVLKATRSECDDAKHGYEAQQKEKAILEKAIGKLKFETENLRKNLAIKNVSEHQLEDIRRQVNRYKTMFNLKVLKITKHEALFELYGNTVSVEMSNSCEISKFSVTIKEDDPFHEIAKIPSEAHFVKLSNLIRILLKRFALASSIRKEISILKEKIKTEVFSLNGLLYLRFYLDMNKNVLDLNITSSFNLVSDELIVCNLFDEPGMLTSYVKNRINKEIV